MPEIIDPVFAKTSQNARFLLSENERFGLVFVKTGSINSGTAVCLKYCARIYRPSFGHENDRFRENKPKPLVFNLIRTQKRRSRLVLDEIILGGGFQIRGLGRGRDQCPNL